MGTQTVEVTSVTNQERPFSDVVTISHPGFDEITAKVLLERFLGAELGVHAFADSINMSDEQIDSLETAGVFVVDLGRNQYKNRSCRSATEVVAKEFSTTLTEGEKELVQLANQDNETGILNKYLDGMSIPWTLRKVYEIPAYGNDPQNVVERMSHVVHTWLRYNEFDKRDRNPSRDNTGMMTELSDLVSTFRLANRNGDLMFNHFTTVRYMRDMWSLDVPVDEIRERVTFWIEAFNNVRAAIIEGERKYKMLNPEIFSTGRLTGKVLESGDPFINRAALSGCDILVAKDSATGHALIATHGLNISYLVTVLNRQEPGKWFEIRGWAVNGGLRNRGTAPTKHTNAELVELVKRFPPQIVDTTESKK